MKELPEMSNTVAENEIGQLFDGVLNAVCIVDAKTMRVIEVNQRALSLLQRTRDEIVGCWSCHDISPCHPDCLSLNFECIQSEWETVLTRKDGSTIPVWTGVGRATINGQEVHIHTHFDLRVIKKMENALV
ncbi:MAG: PAS domain-containing protein, partial [Desulfuromonadales bacterium]|nr:PAS domain-containing protein [Desulfuromonadales bacterium]